MDLLVDLCRIANRAADLLTQKGGILFAQPMNQRLDTAQADLKPVRHLVVRRRSMLLIGSKKTFSVSNVDAFFSVAYSWRSWFMASPSTVIAHRASKIFSAVKNSTGSNR